VTAVRASGLFKSFDATRAVDGVNLTVNEGEVRGLLGPNGAGKTTLLRMLFGLVAPDSGAIELFGRALDRTDPTALAGVAGFVEVPSFYPYLTGRANLELLAQLDSGDAHTRIDAALDRVGLTGRGGDRVSGYSTGMRQRLGIAAALLRAPHLLLLDEPTAGLDPAGLRETAALVRQLSAEGTAILLSSHQIGEIEGICDGFTFMRHGKVVWDGTTEQLRAQAPAGAYALNTSDDGHAVTVGAGHAGVSIIDGPDGRLTITALEGALDPYVVALGKEGVAVRRLELLVSPLEAMFFALTSDVAEGTDETHALAGSTPVQT
jgi:ABC-2 type transport system ATP-binding protein